MSVRHLRTVETSLEGHMICHMLHGHGLMAEVHGDYLHGARGELPAHGHVQVVVPEIDYEKAQRILDEFESSYTFEPEEHSSYTPPLKKEKHRISLFIMFVFGVLCGVLWTTIYYKDIDKPQYSITREQGTE